MLRRPEYPLQHNSVDFQLNPQLFFQTQGSILEEVFYNLDLDFIRCIP